MEEIKAKTASFWSLQDALLAAESEINESEDLSKLIGQVADKVDGIKTAIDILEADALRWAGYAADATKRKKAAENALERLKGYVTSSLKAHETTFELGNQWKVSLTENERVTIRKDPTIDDLLERGYLGVIKTEYAWDKKGVKALLEAGNEDIKKIASIEKTNSVKFSPNTKRNGK